MLGSNSREAFGPDYLRTSFPRAFVAPNGEVFGISADKMWYLDADANNGSGAISYMADFKQPYGELADPPNVGALSVAVMYDIGKIIQVGGNGGENGDGLPASNMATVIDINEGSPQLIEQARMHHARRYGNGIVLANGEVVITGGTTLGNYYPGAERDRGSEAVYAAEIWRPDSGTWQLGASASTIRVYHSITSLLLNGTIISTGGGTPGPVLNKEGEIYYPPYLFSQQGDGSQLATRPQLIGISGLSYANGAAIEVDMSSPETIDSLVLVGLSNGTHSFNSGQRRVPLSFTQEGMRLSGQIPSGNIAPPGYYQVVAINSNGVPSYGVVVAIGDNMAPPQVPTQPYDPGGLDTDSDGDGVVDNLDDFPNDPTESRDSDGDGVGDNADAFPNNPAETADSDADGVGDNSDAFPEDPTESRDSDGDGSGDNSDPTPYGGVTRNQLGAWLFNEGNGASVSDSSTYANPLNAANLGWEPALEGFGGTFNGVNSVATPGRALLDTSGDFSVSAWVKLSNLDGWRTVVNQDGENISGFWLQYSQFINGGKFLFTMHETDSTTGSPAHRAVSTTTPELNRWYHIVGVRDQANSQIKLYVNGQLEAVQNYAGGWSAEGALNVGRGRWGAPNDWFAGAIDNVSVYGEALQDNQVNTLFNAGGVPVAADIDSDADGLANFQDIYPNDPERAGGIWREAYLNIPGAEVSDLSNAAKFPNSPDSVAALQQLEGPSSWDENYGSRIHGIIKPPTSGSYVFWVAGDDQVVLNLSSDHRRENSVQIASVPSSVGPREWQRYPQQQSAGIPLIAGQSYYIEVLHKEQGGDDHVAVAWQGPNDSEPGLLDAQDFARAQLIPSTAPPLAMPISEAGDALTYNLNLGLDGASYTWNFGDGSPEFSTPSDQVSHQYQQPGLYLVSLRARFADGSIVVGNYLQAVATQRTALAPARSSAIAVQNTGRVWSVNPDNDSVSVIDPDSGVLLAEIATGVSPRNVAFAPDGRVWVTNKGSASISIIDAESLQPQSELALPRASQPHGLVFSPDGLAVYVALEARGEVLKLNPITGDIQARAALGAHIRHLGLSADSAKLLVSRFVTPPLAGESSVNVDTGAGGGEVLWLDTANMSAAAQTIYLQYSQKVDNEIQGAGLPNYLAAAAIAPDGSAAWLPSKQDNITRGAARSGAALDFQNTVRAISSRIDMSTLNEDYALRIDHDNASLAAAAIYHPSGIYVFVALETSREVAVHNALNGAELFRISTGLAPQDLALAANGHSLYVHNFMSRSVSVVDLRPLTLRGELQAPLLQSVASISSEALSQEVLLGKQLFYDAADDRLARDNYLSCATCHNDGGSDGRVWDLSGFGEGLRNTINLKGRAAMAQGLLHWSANFDEVQDFEGQIRNLAGGSGLMQQADYAAGTRSQPLGDPKAGLSTDLDALAAYVASLDSFDNSPYRSADGSLSAAAVAGREIFIANNCASCHGGNHFSHSDNSANLYDVGTLQAASGERLGGPLLGIDVPTLRDVWQSAPYLHDGSAADLAAAVAAHSDISLSDADMSQLLAFLRQIGAEETAVDSPSSADAD